MTLPYLAGSLAGIAVLVSLCAALFGTKRAAIPSRPALEAYLAQSVPGLRIRAMVRDDDAALIENERDGAIHLIVARGDGLVTRQLSPALLRAVSREGATLSLRLTDFTLPSAKLALQDSEAAARWDARLAR
jgi:hypothetical protein